MKTFFELDIAKLLAFIIILIGWFSGHVSGWIAIPILLLCCEIKITDE